MASTDAYRQELLLFDIKSFIRPKWDKLSEHLKTLDHPIKNGLGDMGVHLLDSVWTLAPGILGCVLRRMVC